MKQSNKLIIGIIAALLVVVGILVVYNLQKVEDQQDLLTVYVNEEEIIAYTPDDTLSLDNVVNTTLTQNMNSQPSVDRNLTVITVKDLLAQTGIDVTTISEVSVTALDGFVTTYTTEEIQSDNDVYIILLEDGDALSNEDGNFSMATPNDADSKRWTRQVYLLNVTLS